MMTIKSHLLSLTVLVFLSFLSYQSLFSQSIARDGFEPGMKALQFGVGSDFRLTNFNGSVLSAKKFITKNKARFVGISLNSEFDIEDSETNETDIRTTQDGDYRQTNSEIGSRSYDGYASDFNLNITIGNTYYVDTKTDILPFYSVGLSLGANVYDSNNKSEISMSQETEWNNSNAAGMNMSEALNTSKINRFSISPSIGLQARFGVEWFIAKNISLTSEYGIAFSTSYHRISDDQDISNNSETTRINDQNVSNSFTTKRFSMSLYGSGVLFGLSAYF